MSDLEISILIPVFNSADILPRLMARLLEVRKLLPANEILFVDDGSSDGSWKALQRFQSLEPNIKILKLKKNAGVDCALLAGLRISKGERVVILDDDLQQAPEDIPRALSLLDEGYDVLYGKYDKKRQTLLKNFGSWIHDWMARVVHSKPKGIHLSSFKVLRRKIVEEVIQYKFPYPYVDGLILRAASKVGYVPLTHYPRASGEGNHNFLRSSRIFFNSLTTFSFLPLRLLLVAGVLFILGASVWFLLVVLKITESNSHTLSTVLLFLLGGIQLLGMGLLGEYIGRVYMGLGQKPQYLIEEMT